MSKKAMVPLLTGATITLLALPIVGTFRASARAEERAAAPQEKSCDAFVALTFDDGPTPLTAELLSILADHDARATMFNVGGAVEEHPEMVQEQLDAGHAVENHTTTHADLTTLTPEQVAEEITGANTILHDAGADPQWFRPPYGYTDDRVKAAVAAAGLQEVIWTTDTFDWKESTAEQLVERALAVEPGGIILMHDGQQRTIDALPAILDGLAERGLCFGQIVPDTVEHAPAEWHSNTYMATAGPWEDSEG
jgi:peptidoglycan/xylan/chitin deacetylase (PgdA/CDA1 family)